MKVFKFFIGFIILCIFTIFAAANTHIVPIYYFLHANNTSDAVGTIDSFLKFPTFILVYLCFGMGFIVAWILSSGFKRVFKKQIKQLKKQLSEKDDELTRLRNLPVSAASAENPESEV